MLKYNDVKTKRGVELAEHLLAYNQAQETYFKDNSSLINALKQWEIKFKGQIAEVILILFPSLCNYPLCPHVAEGQAGRRKEGADGSKREDPSCHGDNGGKVARPHSSRP